MDAATRSVAIVGVVGAVVVGSVVGWTSTPAGWEVEAHVEVAVGVAEMGDYVATAEAVTRWLGWAEDLDPGLTWSCAGPTECSWSGKGLGSGVLHVFPGDNGWSLTTEPDEGVDWHGSLLVSTAGVGSAVSWRNAGDWGTVPLARFFATEAAESVRARMVRSLSRLKRLAETEQAARRAKPTLVDP